MTALEPLSAESASLEESSYVKSENPTLSAARWLIRAVALIMAPYIFGMLMAVIFGEGTFYYTIRIVFIFPIILILWIFWKKMSVFLKSSFIFLIVSLNVTIFFIAASYFKNNETSDDVQTYVDGDSMDYRQRQKYNNLNSDGKAYVDDQMRKYDAYCSRTSEC